MGELRFSHLLDANPGEFKDVRDTNTPRKICVKIEKGGMYHFRWIERVRAATYISILFLHEEDLKMYQFAATVNQRDEPVDFSKLKHHSFSEINKFMIPVHETLNVHSDVFPIDIYAQQKGSAHGWIHIKSIDYSSENEVDELQIATIRGNTSAAALNQLFSALKQSNKEIKNGLQFQRQFQLQSLPIITWLDMAKPQDLFDVTAYRGKLVIERLIVEVFDLSTECVHWLLHQKKDDKRLLQWLVEDRKLYRLFPHYRGIMSGFRVCYQLPLLDRFWLKFEERTKMDAVFRFKSADDFVSDETEYSINDVVYPLDSNPSVKGVPRQSLRNESLFGDNTILMDNQQIATAACTLLLDHNSDGKYAKAAELRNERICLQVSSHRGYFNSNCSPIKLLELGTSSYYSSGSKHGPLNEDWIIFKVKRGYKVVPTMIVVRNSENDHAIKTISIAGSSDNQRFEEWCKLENIQNINRHELQIFAVDPLLAHLAFVKDFKHFRINILENYGGLYDEFYEFGLRGEYLNFNANEFIDGLTVDQYGSIFVDNIPSTTYPFQLGQEVQLIDGSIATVCQMRTDKICVKIENDEMFHFRWIERVRAPRDVTIVFLHKNDLKLCEFAATVNQRNESVDFSKLKHYSFSKINDFTIPLREMLIDHSGVSAIDIYSKPKDSNYEWARIKSIDYVSKTVVDESKNKSICGRASAAAFNQLIAALKHRDKEIKNGQQFLRQFGIQTLSLAMWPDTATLQYLFDVTLYRRKLVIERLIVEVFGLSTECIHWILNQKKDNKPLLQWLVEHRKVFRLLHHYRVMSSIFKMTKCSRLLNCSWLTSSRNTKMDHVFGIKSDDDFFFQQTDHRIDRTVVPFANITVDGFPEVVSVKNEGLFGDKEIELQRFKQTIKVKESRRYLGDMLNVDAFGVISPQLDVGMNVQVRQRVDRPVLGKLSIARGDVDKSGSWSYNGSSRDAICVEVNRECYLSGIEVFDCDEKLEIECKIYEGNNGEDSGPVIYQEPQQTFECHTRIGTPFELKFKDAVLLKKDTKYTIEILQKNYEGRSRNVKNGKRTVETEGLIVTFSRAKETWHRTDENSGAFPILHFMVLQDWNWFRGIVSRVTECAICTKIENDDMSIFQWIDKVDIWTKMKFENKQETTEFEFAASAGSKDGSADTSYLKTFTFENMQDVQIPCNKLIANSFPVDSIQIYARPKGTKLEYQHIKTLVHPFNSWFVCRYVVDQKEPVCIDKLIKVNPLSEPLQRCGKFNLVATSKIVVSESGGICVLDQPKESQSKQEDDARFIYLSAPNDVVNRGTLCCEGTKEASRVGTVHIITNDLFENDGRIDTGQGGRIKIECARFVNEGQITPIPNVLIGKWATKIRKFEICSKYHEIKNNGLDVCGTSYSCSRYLVYPEVFGPNGILRGTHFWSILAVGDPGCYPNVGVLPEKVWLDKMDSAVGYWPSDSIERLKPRVKFNHKFNPTWRSGETLTVVLDCDRYKVEYFKNEKKMEQCDVIERGKSWYFAMTFCAQPKNHYRVVETPLAVLRHYE